MVGVGALVVGGGRFWVILGVFALVMDFQEVMLTSPPELAHRAPLPLPTEILLGLGSLGTYFLIVDLISRYA